MLNNNDNFIDKLYGTVSRDRVLTAEPMSRHTTFRIGGPADYLVSPASMEEIAASSQTLARLAEELKSAVSQFKIR